MKRSATQFFKPAGSPTSTSAARDPFFRVKAPNRSLWQSFAHRIWVLALFVAIPSPSSDSIAVPTSNRPNIVFPLADDQGWTDRKDNRLELCNLAEDPGEYTSLADRMPDKARLLHDALQRWRERVGAQMPAQNPKYNSNCAPEVSRADASD